MFDYSDEEPDPVRNRNRSPSEVLGSEVHLKPRYFDAKDRGHALKTKTIFRGIGERSSRAIMPTTNLPVPDSFIINEFARDKILRPISKLQNFNVSLKGDDPLFHESPLSRSNNYEDHPDSFFKSMKTIVFLSQFFGVFPVSGFNGPNYNSLAFKWLHFSTCFWFVTVMGTLFCSICATIDGLKNGSFQAASEILFFICGILSSLLMLNLSQNWKRLNKEFAEVEVKLKKFGYPPKITFRFRIFTVSILLGALVEHVLSKTKNYQSLNCYDKKSDVVEAFFLREYYNVFSVIPFNPWLAVVVAAAQFLTTANWNFKDLFLCFISYSIAERFRQIQDLLDKVHGEEKPVVFWKEIREDYNTLTVLTKRVDSHIQKLMLLSIGNNVYFICMQLFLSLKKRLHAIKLVYFFWSFGFLALRTSFVAFAAARINDLSKEPKTVLYSVPQKNYTGEVRRFLTQLTTNEVALTGSGFFPVTRSLILTITGTVITYEIVLAQFGGTETEEVPGNGTVCIVSRA